MDKHGEIMDIDKQEFLDYYKSIIDEIESESYSGPGEYDTEDSFIDNTDYPDMSQEEFERMIENPWSDWR